MTKSTTIELTLEEGHYIETDDHIYKVLQIMPTGEIRMKRLDSGNREYEPEELSRILRFTQNIEIRREWH